MAAILTGQRTLQNDELVNVAVTFHEAEPCREISLRRRVSPSFASRSETATFVGMRV